MIVADNQTPVDVLVLLSIVVPLVLLAIVCWIFWRAWKRDQAAQR